MLDKAIASGKERRRPYRGSARFDRTCRPHGGGRSANQCKWCLSNRTISLLRLVAAARLQEDPQT